MSSAVRYRLSFARAAQSLIDVDACFAVGEATECVLTLPAWSPGSYMVRDYARGLEGMTATDDAGRALPLHKVRKDAFRVQAGAARTVHVRYAVYGREMTVRTNFVCEEFALVQGTATLLAWAPAAAQGQRLEVVLPEQHEARWSSACCGLPRAAGPTLAFDAASYDELVDSPLLCGNPTVDAFEVNGIEHRLATVGGDESWNNAEAAQMAQRLVQQHANFWQQIPYPRYVFLNVLYGGGGGLEHRHSSVVMGDAHVWSSGKSREAFAGLLSHEHFHAWNIKRLRPVALGPFDYAQENYTPSLWVAEGLTAYYDDLQAARAGVVGQEAYLARLAKAIEQLAATPGRQLASLSASSFDAWIKLYKPDENSANTTVSYYLKGSLVGWALDARLRAHSHGQRSLDDVMRLAYARHSGARGFSEAEFRACIEEVAGEDAAIGDWLAAAIDGTDDVDFGPACRHLGLSLTWHRAGDGRPKHRDQEGVVGLHLEGPTGNAVVAQVLRDGSAYAAGFNVGDELVAMDDQRLRADTAIDALTARAQAGAAQVSMLIARRQRLQRRVLPLRRPRPRLAQLAPVAEPSEQQSEALRAWLSPAKGEP